MEFNQYQMETRVTAVYRDKPGTAIIYPALGLGGESGEVLEKVKKLIRDGNGVEEISDEKREEIAYELSDCLWYVAALADDIGYTLNRIAAMNLAKLASRKERGVLGGSGDNR